MSTGEGGVRTGRCRVRAGGCYIPGVSSRPSSPRRRWAAALVLVALVALALALGARALRAAGARLFRPTGDAAWIWARLPRGDSSPVAFYAVQDFTLDAAPARARLCVQADEEYVLWLNGKRVGSGVYAPGAPLDAYEVGPLLRAGGNRLVAELRSGRGVGGFLARLEEGASGRPLAGTDASWRIFRRAQPGLIAGLQPLGPDDGGEPARAWGTPPVGRWGFPWPGPERSALALVSAAEPLVPPRASPPDALGRRLAAAPLRAVFEWEREVEGYLVLDVAPREAVAVGLLQAADGPRPKEARWQVLVVPGSRIWIDARPRRFRRVEVLGIQGIARARVLPSPGEVAPLPAPPPGVLGITPPPLRTPVEEKVQRELEHAAGTDLP